MNQRTLAGFEKYGKVTRRAQFLADMERVMPWDKLIGLIRPHYPTMGEQGGRLQDFPDWARVVSADWTHAE